MIFDVQFNSATTPWPEMLEAVLAAESAGFGVAWVVDHLAGQVMKGDSMQECFTLVGALAATTSTIGVGTLVANVWNRSLGVLAAAAATAQRISGGRFWLGIGAGASPTSPYGAEHRAVGITLRSDMASRQQRVLDFLQLADDMWTDGTIDGVTGFPTPPSRIPIIVGVNSPSLARIAGLHADGLNVRWNHPRLEEIVEAARTAHDVRSEGADDGADTPPFVVTTWQPFEPALLDPDGPDRARYTRLGIDRLIVVQFDRADVSLIRQ